MTSRRTVDRSGVASRSGPGASLTLATVYFFSGVPALVYQTVWQRLLVLHSGVGTVSIAMIVSVYMLGLGLGSLLGAWLSRRSGAGRCLMFFAIAELTISVCGILSPWVLYELMYQKFGSLYGELWRATLLHTAILLLPTTLMGMTLPLMTRSLVSRNETAAEVVSLLYGLNTLGAAFGAMASPWLLMPLTGVKGTVLFAAGVNLAVALFVLWMHQLGSATGRGTSAEHSSSDLTQPKGPAVPEQVSGGELPFRTWASLYFLSGLCAIGLEIIWFRILDIGVKSTAYTFGTVLGVFLSCMAAGSLASLGCRAGKSNPVASFLAVQCVILILSGTILAAVGRISPTLPGAGWYVDYWRSEEPLRPSLIEWNSTFRLYALFPLLLMGIPAVLMGYSFCLLQKGVQGDASVSGFRTGVLQAANIAGCTLGSFLTGTWLLGIAGSMLTLRLLVGSGILFAVIGIRLTGRTQLFGALLLLTAMVMVLIPSGEQFWRRMHGQPSDSGALVAEDVTGVSMLAPHQNGSNWWMWAGGKTQSLLPFGGFHTRLGVMPVTLHPAPETIAIIGLGSGDTAWAAACRSEAKAIRVFEICEPEIRLLQSDFAREKWPQVRQLLDDPRVQIDGIDARFALMTEERTYDVIEADAIRHHGAFAGYLYSEEFFRLCGKRLKRGGLMCSWSPTPLVHTTFRKAFASVIELENGLLLIGSNDPITWHPEEWADRIRKTGKYLPQAVIEDCIQNLSGAKSASPAHPTDFVNSDLFPFDEFN